MLGAPIVDPLVGFGITPTILMIVLAAARADLVRLRTAIEPEVRETVEAVPLSGEPVRGAHEAHAGWLGHRVPAFGTAIMHVYPLEHPVVDDLPSAALPILYSACVAATMTSIRNRLPGAVAGCSLALPTRDEGQCARPRRRNSGVPGAAGHPTGERDGKQPLPVGR